MPKFESCYSYFLKRKHISKNFIIIYNNRTGVTVPNNHKPKANLTDTFVVRCKSECIVVGYHESTETSIF